MEDWKILSCLILVLLSAGWCLRALDKEKREREEQQRLLKMLLKDQRLLRASVEEIQAALHALQRREKS